MDKAELPYACLGSSLCLQLEKVTAFWQYTSSISEIENSLPLINLSVAYYRGGQFCTAWSLNLIIQKLSTNAIKLHVAAWGDSTATLQINDCRKVQTLNIFLHQYSDQLGIRHSAYTANLQHGKFCWILDSPPLKTSSIISPKFTVPSCPTLPFLTLQPGTRTSGYCLSPCKQPYTTATSRRAKQRLW